MRGSTLNRVQAVPSLVGENDLSHRTWERLVVFYDC